MKLYVVFDTMGSGRLVGVFDSMEKAKLLTTNFPHYYKMHECELNEIDPKVLDWARNKEQRRLLEIFLKDAREE